MIKKTESEQEAVTVVALINNTRDLIQFQERGAIMSLGSCLQISYTRLREKEGSQVVNTPGFPHCNEAMRIPFTATAEATEVLPR